MSEVVIGITTWGSPWFVYPNNYRWRKVEYVLADDSGCGVSSRTTLSFIFKCISHSLRRFVVIVPSTVVFEPGLNSYDELIQHVKNIYRGFICEEIKKVGDLSPKALDLIVAPGSGKFTNRYKGDSVEGRLMLNYCGSLSNFYYYVYLELSRILVKEILNIENDGDSKKSLKIVLDLSHGMNYMPVLTYRAVNYYLLYRFSLF
ncbi:MAG: TM1812 family CRISPR-associated protein [Sulfolobales archaeon]